MNVAREKMRNIFRGLISVLFVMGACFLALPGAHAQKTYTDPDGTPHNAKLDDVSWKSTATVHIALIGDSTVQPSSGWGPGFASMLKPNVECLNLARGGRSSRTFREEGRWAQAITLKPDYMLIGFSHNDSHVTAKDRYVPLEDFKKNMARFVDEARAAGIKPILMTNEALRRWDEQGHLKTVDDLERYEIIIREVAKEKKVSLLDVDAITHEFYLQQGPEKLQSYSAIKKDGSIDDIHVNAQGGLAIGAFIAEKAKAQVPELMPFIIK